LPSEERVTTGSEPRQFDITRTRFGYEVIGIRQLALDESVQVQEVVEPGHDEQTEACRVCGGRGWHTAGGNDPSACGACAAGEAWYGGDEWQPDPRTIAAVVEALRERAHVLDNSAESASDAVAYATVREDADFIEERFKPSAPGGGRQGGRPT
jgi:hypothetical protein